MLEITVVLSLCIFWIPQAEGNEWKFFCRNTDYYFYDSENINYPYDNLKKIVSVWQKIIYEEESIERISAYLGSRYANLVESVSLVEIDCLNKKAQTKSKTFYDSADRVIETSLEIKQDWKKITPDSPFSKLYKSVCHSK
ncbi:MAG: hypothetical protein L6290_05650 [Thermodesulfovibrionales bacterium]|nr:hypothetical protein [Thermodesulfovibrionales bacterium]